jgi:hypothetical protein
MPNGPRRTIAHVGSLYGARHPGALLSTLERLGGDNLGVLVKLVGPIEPEISERYGTAFEDLRRRGLVEFENRLVARDEAAREIAGADFLLLLDVNEKNASFQVPSKLLDYIRTGKPILAYTATNSPSQRILAQSGIPYLAIDPARPSMDDDRKVLEFLRQPGQVHPASEWFEQEFSAETQACKVAALLDGLLGQRLDGGKEWARSGIR